MSRRSMIRVIAVGLVALASVGVTSPAWGRSRTRQPGAHCRTSVPGPPAAHRGHGAAGPGDAVLRRRPRVHRRRPRHREHPHHQGAAGGAACRPQRAPLRRRTGLPIGPRRARAVHGVVRSRAISEWRSGARGVPARDVRHGLPDLLLVHDGRRRCGRRRLTHVDAADEQLGRPCPRRARTRPTGCRAAAPPPARSVSRAAPSPTGCRR